MCLIKLSRLRLLAIATLVVVLVSAGFLTLDRDTSIAQEVHFGFFQDDIGLVVVKIGEAVDRELQTPHYPIGTVTYAITPSLPRGLSLDDNGKLIGTAPQTEQGKQSYTVTATDPQPRTPEQATASYTFDLIVSDFRFGSSVQTESINSKSSPIAVEVGEESAGAFGGNKTKTTLGNVPSNCLSAPTLEVRKTEDASWNVNALGLSGLKINAPINLKKPIMLAGKPKLAMENQTWQFRVTVRCHLREGSRLANLPWEDASYIVWVKGVPQTIKFRPDSLGTRVLTKDVELTEHGVNRLIKPPELVATVGNVTYALTGGGSLPTGLSFSTSTGVISGTPDTVKGKTRYTITATDSDQTPMSARFTVDIEVIDPMAFASASLSDQTLTVNTQMTALNPPTLRNAVGTVAYAVSPNLPAGLSIDPGTGAISGTPSAAATPNTYTATATDSRAGTAQTATYTVSIKVNPAAAMSFSGTKSAQVLIAGRSANVAALSLSDSVGTVTYGISPNLPAGLSFSTSNGGITGTPNTHHSNTSYTITATDANGQTDNYSFKIEVKKLRWASPVPQDTTVTAGQQISLSAPVPDGGVGTTTYTISPAASHLPDGVTFNSSNGEISGTTTAAFTQRAFTVTLSDSASPPQRISYTVNITVNNTTPTVTFASAASAPSESAGTHNVVLNFSPAPTAASTTVRYGVAGTAKNGTDYNTLYGSVQVARGVTTVNIAVTIIDDSVDDDDEEIIVTLSSASAYTIGSTRTHTITITDNDDAPSLPVVSLSLNSGASVQEGVDDRATWSINIDSTSHGNTTVYWTSSATGGLHRSSDVTSGNNWTFPRDGHTSQLDSIFFERGNATTDGVDEPNGVWTITLNTSSSYTLGSSHAISVPAIDGDPTSVMLSRIDSGSIAEGSGSAELYVRLGRRLYDGETIEVPLVLSGTNITAADVNLAKKPGSNINHGVSVSGGNALTPTVTFTGHNSNTVQAARLLFKSPSDSTQEGAETVTVALGPNDTTANGFDLPNRATNVGGGADPHATSNSVDVVIDGQGATLQTPVISITGGTFVTEGTNASFTVTANPAPSSPLTVSVAVTQSGDFVSSSGRNITSVQIPTSGSIALSVPTIGDSVDEANGSVTVTINAGDSYLVSTTSGAAIVSVLDNDITEATFAASTSTAAESAGTRNVAVNLSPVPAIALTLSYAIQDASTATAGSDYARLSGSVSVAAGASSVNIPVRITNDSTDESDETIILSLSSGAHYTVGSARTHTLTITDNDVPSAQFHAASGTAPENAGAHNVRVNISPAPAVGLTLRYSVGGTATSGDFSISSSGSLSVSQGQTSATIPVSVINDGTHEESETVILTLSSGTGYSLGSRTIYTLTISDDDLGVDVQDSPTNVQFTQGQLQTVNLGSVVGGHAGVTCQLAGGTLPAGISLQCTQPRLTGAATHVESAQVRVRLSRNGDQKDLTVNVNVVAGAQGSSTSNRRAIIPSDPPNFCRGTVSDVTDPAQQQFPTLGRDVAPQGPCRGSGSLTLHNLANTLNEDQTERERGFYITAQLHSTSDYRSRFRGGIGSRLYVVDSSTETRYRLLSGQRMIELSIWLIVERPEQDSKTTTRLGRNERLNEEFSICLPFTPTKRHPIPDIARWSPAERSWDILPLTFSGSEEQVCALTDQVSSFMLVIEDEQSSPGPGPAWPNVP